MGNEINNYEHFIVSLFLFLQEFTRMKWSENKNKERKKNFFYCEMDDRHEEGNGGLNEIYNIRIYMYI